MRFRKCKIAISYDQIHLADDFCSRFCKFLGTRSLEILAYEDGFYYVRVDDDMLGWNLTEEGLQNLRLDRSHLGVRCAKIEKKHTIKERCRMCSDL